MKLPGLRLSQIEGFLASVPAVPECLTEFPDPPEPTPDSLAQTWFGTA